MDQKNQFIKTITIGTVITLTSAIQVVAQEISQPNSRLTPKAVKLAQTERSTDSTADKTQEIIKPAQTPIESTEELNPDEDPLSLPTQVDKVNVNMEKPITLEQALDLSFNNNPDVAEAKLEVERSEAGLREARAAWFPTLDLGSDLNYGNSAFLDSPIEQNIDSLTEEAIEDNPGVSEDVIRENTEARFTDTDSASFNFNNSLTVGFSIYNGGARGAQIETAKNQLRSSELGLKTAIEVVEFETSRDYYGLQNADAQVEIEEASVEDASQTLKDAQLLEKAGLGTRFDVLRAEVELAQAQQRLSTANANQNISRRQLAETINVSHDTDLSTADKIEEAGTWEFSLEESIVQAFENRAELEQLLLQKDIAGEQRSLALSQVRPNLSANASYGINNDFEDDDIDFNDNYQVGLSLQWRLFDGGAARAAARQSEKDGEIAEVQFTNQRNQIRFAVEQAFFQLESNKNNIGTATKEVELAEESLRLARLRFSAGVGTQTDVIEAQTQLTTARGNLVSSIIQYNQSFIDLQRQVSEPTEIDVPQVENLESDTSEENSEIEAPESDTLEVDAPETDTPEENPETP